MWLSKSFLRNNYIVKGVFGGFVSQASPAREGVDFGFFSSKRGLRPHFEEEKPKYLLFFSPSATCNSYDYLNYSVIKLR